MITAPSLLLSSWGTHMPAVSTPALAVDTKATVAVLTLKRPERRNALSHSLLHELDDALTSIAADHSIRVVVIGSEGSVFCSGHDLSEMVGCSEEAYRELFGLCSRVMYRLRQLPQPVIARVQGMATAAGCQLVAACDLAVAAENATFATPGVKIGLFCTTPMVPLVRAIPARPALEMLLTGKPISAQRAYELGLVNRVVPAAQLDAAVQEYVEAILASSDAVIRLGKKAFYAQLSVTEAAAYESATAIMTENATWPDAQEGMAAFLQKRKPR
jgi:enoyl-CoA hydratase/carnithine racemase